MATFTISELQNVNSTRKGYTVEAKDLAAAKRIASKKQFFQGTVLEISDAKGRLAVKENGKWENLF